MLKQGATWLVVVLVMIAVAGGLFAYKRNELDAANAAASATPEPAETVGTVRARLGTWSPKVRAIGTVVALRQIEIRNELAGTVARLGFESGAVVEKGQLLIEFDISQEQAALAAAEAEARLTKLTLNRRQALSGSPAYSSQEHDKAREELAAAEARVRGLEATIEKKRIRSPFRARVGITNLQPGAYLDVGTLIARLQGINSDAYVDFSLPQDSAAEVGVGTKVTLSGPGIPNGTATASIVAEDDSIDASNRMVRLRAVASELGNAIRPGAFVDVHVVTSRPQETVFVPLAAVRRSTGGEHVFVIVAKDGVMRAEQRGVVTGPVDGDDIAIAKGLSEGELIAATGSFKLRDGAAVQAEPATAAPISVGTN